MQSSAFLTMRATSIIHNRVSSSLMSVYFAETFLGQNHTFPEREDSIKLTFSINEKKI